MTPPPVRPGGQVLPLRPSGHEDAVRVAIQWLEQRHRKGWDNATRDLLALLLPAPEKRRQSTLDEDGAEALGINANEWLLARGDMFVKGGMRSINAHLLGSDGPYLSPAQQRWIAQLSERPLRLYRVTDVRLDEGLTLVDALDTAADPLVVHERSGTRSAQPGMLMGARVMLTDGQWQLSGAVYPFAKLREAATLARVQAALDAGLHPENTLALAEMEIARAWLAQWFEPLPLPDMRDAGTGDALLLVTDHYRVHDAAALHLALAAQADVTGDATQGWHRDEAAAGGGMRSRVAINPGKQPDRIELFARTQRLADEGRAWFGALAGQAVQYLTREVVDPRGAMATHARGKAPSQARRAAPELPPEVMAELMAQALQRAYAHWADEPVPVLGNQTPRQAMATPAGLERVKGLLREYEAGEAEMARRDGRAPASYQFLWESLGLTR